MNKLFQDKYKYLLIIILISTIAVIGFWGYRLIGPSSAEIKGIKEGRTLVFTDDYIDILDYEKASITEDKKPQDWFGLITTKKWFSLYTNDNLKNGFEAWYIMDKVESLDQTITKYNRLLGINNPINKKLTGCNDNVFTQLSDNNVLPINYYLSIKGNRVFVLKHYKQLKANQYTLNLNNFCLKN
jgi:hypothetical protein